MPRMQPGWHWQDVGIHDHVDAEGKQACLFHVLQASGRKAMIAEGDPKAGQAPKRMLAGGCWDSTARRETHMQGTHNPGGVPFDLCYFRPLFSGSKVYRLWTRVPSRQLSGFPLWWRKWWSQGTASNPCSWLKSCVTVGKLLNFSEPHCLLKKNLNLISLSDLGMGCKSLG